MNETNAMSGNTRLDSRAGTRRRNAIRITFIVGILLAGISAPGLFTIAPSASSQYAGNIITFVAGLLGLICAWVSYRHSATGGSLAFIASFLAISLGIPFYANGLGLQAGIIAAVIVIAIATATLESRLAVRISLAALIVEALVILMDF